MNKDVVKKYKEAFDCWLNGGGVWKKYHYGWKLLYIVYWNDSDAIYVQNDEYAELRKAGADNKQLQVSYDEGKTWYDKTTRKITWTDSQWVRIKPDEPKFKVGDWVRDKTNCTIVKLGEHYHEGGIELWQPKELDIVICWQDNCNYQRLICEYKKENSFDNVIPYIGQSFEEMN